MRCSLSDCERTTHHHDHVEAFVHRAVMARMVFERGGAKARARATQRDARGAAADGEPPGALGDVPAQAERMSFFESSYELHAGLEVVESSWSEALDICPDSGWSALPPLPPARNRQAR